MVSPQGEAEEMLMSRKIKGCDLVMTLFPVSGFWQGFWQEEYLFTIRFTGLYSSQVFEHLKGWDVLTSGRGYFARTLVEVQRLWEWSSDNISLLLQRGPQGGKWISGFLEGQGSKSRRGALGHIVVRTAKPKRGHFIIRKAFRITVKSCAGCALNNSRGHHLLLNLFLDLHSA